MAIDGFGRPCKYSKEDLEKIGKDLIAWCRKEGSWHISGFEDENDLPTEFCGDMARNRPDHFFRVYKRAKGILGRKMMALTMEKSGPTPWMQATLLPMYLEDIDKHLDKKEDRKAQMAEKAKGASGQELDARVVNLLEKLDTHSEANDERKGS
tara:strand:- start:511 stop:969 length:459 start_codon:yes stop_codon:yes gene_type:complete